MRLILCLLAILFSVSACSHEQLKRGTYSSMQEYQRLQCNKNLEECPDRESYEDYQRKREELEN